MARVHRAVKRQLKTYQKKLKRSQGKLGLGDGTSPEVSGHPYLVRARPQGSNIPIIVHNVRGAPNIDNWPVVLGESETVRKVLQVLETNTRIARNLPPSSSSDPHGSAHYYDGTDPIWIHTKQITPLLVYVVSGMTIGVLPGWIMTQGSGVIYVQEQTLDLTSSIPANARWALVQISSAGALNVKLGTDMNLVDLGWDDVPSPDNGSVALAVVRLYANMTSISNTIHSPDLFDIRLKPLLGGDYTDSSGVMTIGAGAAGVDYRIKVDGETNDGIIDWMEDEDYFRVQDDMLWGDATNGLMIDRAGELTLRGTATVWDDIRITPGSFDRPGTSDPALRAYQPGGSGTTTYLYEFEVGDIASFTVQMPHSYKVGEDIYVHIHWTPGPRGNEENGATVGWKIDYTWASINGTFGAMSTADLSDACDGTDHKHQMTTDVAISGSGMGISSMLICNVKRTDTGSDDTWSGTVSGELPLLLEIDFHFPMDTMGSKERSSK